LSRRTGGLHQSGRRRRNAFRALGSMLEKTQPGAVPPAAAYLENIHSIKTLTAWRPAPDDSASFICGNKSP